MTPPELIKPHRQIGYDVARALAIFGMVIVNFKVTMEADQFDPDWAIRLVGLLDGRAAATFVILAGVGISLLSRRAREQGDTRALAAKRKLLVKRAAFLFCFGLIFATIWPGDILHFYGIYLLVGAALINISDRKLWSIATALIICFVVLIFSFDYEKGWNWETLEYHGFWTFSGMIRHLFFNGFHPVIPWVAFLLVGMWLGRQDLTKPALRMKILAWGLGAIVLAETASCFLPNWILLMFPEANSIDIIDMCATAPIPPMPQYLLSAGGSAIVVIVTCIAATEKFASFSILFKPFVATGQMALTLYVAHVIIGMGLLEHLGLLYHQSIGMAVFSTLCFCTCAIVFSVFWRRYFKHGPLEWVMRTISK